MPVFTREDVVTAWTKAIQSKKASGPFLLTFNLLLRCGQMLITPLLILFNNILLCSSFPVSWKTSFVTAIPKGSLDSSKPTNWRPISLLHPLSKVLESAIASRLRAHLEANCRLTTHQFGFRPQRSTELLLTTTVQEWLDSLSTGKPVDAVFLDCQKAFDRADHSSILFSLINLDVPPVFIGFFADYLRNRKQVTVVDGTQSAALSVTSGVPQGSILGPLLFICLVNSVVRNVSPNTSIRMFADDVAIYRVIRTANDEADFQQDLNNIQSWADEVKLTFSPSKSSFIRFWKRRTLSQPPDYRLGMDIIPKKETVKYLGVFLDHDLGWKTHVENLASKAKKRIRYICALFDRRCQRARIVLFHSLVVPLLEYCFVVCNPDRQYLIDDLESCVKEFLKNVNIGPAEEDTSAERYCSRLRQLGLEPIIFRRIKQSLILAYKMIFRLVPVGHDLFEPFSSVAAVNFVAGNTRQTVQVRSHPRPVQPSSGDSDRWRTGNADGSFVHMICRIWNILPLDDAAFSSLNSFATSLDFIDWSSVRYVNDYLGKYFCFFSA